MVDFINEVEEELRKDDYNKFLRKYGPFLLGLIIAVVLIAAYFEFSKARNERAARSVSAAYVEASEIAADGEVDDAIRRFLAIAEKSPSGYAGLSYMRAASLQLDKGEALESVRLFDQAADAFEKPRHADLARLKASYVLVGQGRYDDARTRLVPMSQKDAPYEYLSRELLALSLKETGDINGAKAEYSYLENIPGVPPTVQARAKQAMTLIRVSESLAAPNEKDISEATNDTPQATLPSDEEAVEETGDE